MQYSMLKQGRCPATQSSNGSQSYAGWKKQHLCQARGGRCYTTVHASSAPSGPSTPPERPKTAARAFSGAAAPMPQPSFPGFPLPGANTKPAEQTASGAAEGQPQGNTKANTDSRQQARTIDIAGT